MNSTRHDPYENFQTEQLNENTKRIDELDALGVVRAINREDMLVAAALAKVEKKVALVVEESAKRFRKGGRLIYVGAGTSGRLGVLDAAEQFPTFGVPEGRVIGVIAGGEDALTRAVEGAEDSIQDGRFNISVLNAGELDVVVGLSASGSTPFVTGALQEGKARGAMTVLFTCNPSLPEKVASLPDHLIIADVGPEVIAGSTRLKAGTVTKLFLNTLSTGVMILNGKVYGNLMVDVRPANRKLVARARRIMRMATGLDDETAEKLVLQAGNLKLAIFMHLSGLEKDEASVLLEKAGGHIKKALSMLHGETRGLEKDKNDSPETAGILSSPG